jgi:hypothetical protein
VKAQHEGRVSRSLNAREGRQAEGCVLVPPQTCLLEPGPMCRTEGMSAGGRLGT